jgi:hypothetical protein
LIYSLGSLLGWSGLGLSRGRKDASGCSCQHEGMVLPAVSDDAGTVLYPRRFHSARERNERLGRWLRVVAGVTTVDERLLDRLGRRMFARDELGAQLVTAMRRPERRPPTGHHGAVHRCPR